jgi:hypothetical protein
MVTDFDRLNAGLFSTRAAAEAKAKEMAANFPGNAIHVLESVSVCQGAIGGQIDATSDLKDFPQP